jgi:hypothetical protein
LIRDFQKKKRAVDDVLLVETRDAVRPSAMNRPAKLNGPRN